MLQISRRTDGWDGKTARHRSHAAAGREAKCPRRKLRCVSVAASCLPSPGTPGEGGVRAFFKHRAARLPEGPHPALSREYRARERRLTHRKAIDVMTIRSCDSVARIRNV